MKSEEKIKEAMENIKNQLPEATGQNEALVLQSQYSTLKWVLKDEEDKNEEG